MYAESYAFQNIDTEKGWEGNHKTWKRRMQHSPHNRKLSTAAAASPVWFWWLWLGDLEVLEWTGPGVITEGRTPPSKHTHHKSSQLSETVSFHIHYKQGIVPSDTISCPNKIYLPWTEVRGSVGILVIAVSNFLKNLSTVMHFSLGWNHMPSLISHVNFKTQRWLLYSFVQKHVLTFKEWKHRPSLCFLNIYKLDISIFSPVQSRRNVHHCFRWKRG